MASSSMLLICALLLLSTTLLIDASKYPDVRDVLGDSLVPGSCYQFLAAEPPDGGGLILSGKDPVYPDKLYLSTVGLIGKGPRFAYPVRVTPEEPTATHVWLEARVTLQFSLSSANGSANPWVLRPDENDGETYIVRGLEEEKPSFFNFKEAEGEKLRYTLNYCNGPCKQVGIKYNKSNVGELVAGGSTPYNFMFVKDSCYSPKIRMPFM